MCYVYVMCVMLCFVKLCVVSALFVLCCRDCYVCVVLWCLMLRYAVLRNAMHCRVMLGSVMLRYVQLCSAMQCFVMLVCAGVRVCIYVSPRVCVCAHVMYVCDGVYAMCVYVCTYVWMCA